MTSKNQTGRRSLDVLANDARIESITSMPGPENWYTLSPEPGWTCDPLGAHAAVEPKVAGIIRAAKSIRPCDCAECRQRLQDRADGVTLAYCPTCRMMMKHVAEGQCLGCGLVVA